MDGKLEIIEGTILSAEGVTPVQIGAHTTPDALGWGYPGIVYTPMDMPTVRNGDVMTFRHAILLCACGGLEGACGCERG